MRRSSRIRALLILFVAFEAFHNKKFILAERKKLRVFFQEQFRFFPMS
jgi:hypothetical protein